VRCHGTGPGCLERFERRVLTKLDAQQVYNESLELAAVTEPMLILPREASPGRFGHRRIVAAWFERESGIKPLTRRSN
jgi:hypothetical protein